MYGLLQPIFPKWFELVLLRPFPMDLHHLWGGPFAVKKMRFLVHKIVGNLSFSEPFHFFFFGHQKPCEKDPRLFPDLLCPFLILLLCFPGENER